MLRTKLLFAALSAAALTSACAPVVGQNGFQAIDAKPADIVAGTDTKQTVLTKLGTPSTTIVSPRTVKLTGPSTPSLLVTRIAGTSLPPGQVRKVAVPSS